MNLSYDQWAMAASVLIFLGAVAFAVRQSRGRGEATTLRSVIPSVFTVQETERLRPAVAQALIEARREGEDRAAREFSEALARIYATEAALKVQAASANDPKSPS